MFFDPVFFNPVDKNPSSDNPKGPASDEVERPRINGVLGIEDSGRQGLFGVLWPHGNGLLEHDRARIEPGIDEMHRRARPAHTRVQGLFLWAQTRKRREKRRMDVQDWSAESRDEIRREEAHVARKTEHIHGRVEGRQDLSLVVFASPAPTRESQRPTTCRTRYLERASTFRVACDFADSVAAVVLLGGEEGGKVAAATACQDSDALQARVTRASSVTAPIRTGLSPRARKDSTTVAAWSTDTTRIMPIPMLNVRNISSLCTAPPSAIS